METVETPGRAMVVVPHPDDGESGCAGTVARWIREGAQVLYVVCTNGDKGTADPEMTSQRLAQLREEEQRRAVQVLGVHEAVFLGHPDGELEDDRAFRGELVREIRRFKPQVVLAMDPYRSGSHTHRDHRISGQVALDACFPYARDPLHYAEQTRDGLEPHKVSTVLLWGTEQPDVAVDIFETLDIKLKALSAHESQLSGPGFDVAEFVKRWARRAAERAEDTGYEYAETFRKLSFRG